MSNFYENRIKCGKCNTEFDLYKNDGCPLCGFGSGGRSLNKDLENKEYVLQESKNYLVIPSDLELNPGELLVDNETKSVGSWGMFNSFFPGKAVLRILANLLDEKNVKSITLETLMIKTSDVIRINNLSELRGFPKNPGKDNSLGRLVYHFIQTFTDMGFFSVNTKEKTKNNQKLKNCLF